MDSHQKEHLLTLEFLSTSIEESLKLFEKTLKDVQASTYQLQLKTCSTEKKKFDEILKRISKIGSMFERMENDDVCVMEDMLIEKNSSELFKKIPTTDGKFLEVYRASNGRLEIQGYDQRTMILVSFEEDDERGSNTFVSLNDIIAYSHKYIVQDSFFLILSQSLKEKLGNSSEDKVKNNRSCFDNFLRKWLVQNANKNEWISFKNPVETKIFQVSEA